MRQTKVGKVRRWGMAAALVTVAVGTGAAHAALIKAKWDPEYGPAFPGLAFTGEAEFYVPDSLLNVGPIMVPTFFGDIPACAGGETGPTCISLRSAFVELYTFDINLPYSTSNRTYQQTLTYASPVGLYGSTVTPDALQGVVLQYDSGTEQNEVIGASSFLVGPVAVPADSELDIILGSIGSFFMRLGPGPDAPPDGTQLPGDAADPYKVSTLFACVPTESGGCAAGSQSNPATVVFSRAPEPGSLPLVLGALAAGWAARRSRRPVEPASC